MKKWYTVFLFFPSILFAQGIDIRGTVTDSTNGQRLPFVNVVLLTTTKGAATNINGFYLIPNVQPGKYEIAVSAVGYRRKVQSIEVTSGAPMNLNIRLSPILFELEEVLVTEKAKPELSEISTSVHVLEARDLKMVPSAVQQDIFRSIQILPGITSTSDVSSQFYVRGGAADQNLILLDGMRIYNPYHAFGLFSMFDPDIISTTEVYTGAFPPEYGGRLSSVVSLLTKDGNKSNIAGKANINFLSSKFQIEGPALETVRWLASARKSLFSSSLRNFFHQNVPIEFYDGFLKITSEQDSITNAKLGFQAFVSGDDLNSPGVDQPNYSWKNLGVGFSASALIQDRLFVYATMGGSSFTATRDAKTSKVTTPATTSVKEFSIHTNATLYTDSKDLYFFGFEFSFPAMEYTLVNNLGRSVRIAGTPPQVSAWVRYQTMFGDLKTDVGIHTALGSMLSHGLGMRGFQPRINFSYDLKNSWRAKLSYGRFSQDIIAVNNEDDLISIFDAWIEIPENLQPETADHYVVGFEGNLLENLTVNLQSYYKNYSTLVSYNRDKIDANDPDYINSTGNSYGVEALLRYGSPLMDIYAAYTLGWTSITQNNFTYPPRYDRRHSLKLLSSIHILHNMDITLRWDVGSGLPFTESIGYYDRLTLNNFYDNPFQDDTGTPYTRLGQKNSTRLPFYHRLDAGIDYRFNVGAIRGILGINIINVYDRKNVLYFDRKTGQLINMLSFFPSATLSIEY